MPPERTEVLIVGAGPAGLAAALELRRLGVRDVIVVDREAEAGGIPRLCHHTGFGLRDLWGVYSGPAYARRYVSRAEAAGIQIRASTTITGWRGPKRLAFGSPGGLGEIEAGAILLATGCRERPRAARLVPGNRPQGIFTTGSLQRFVYEHHLPVGRRAVIVGAELVSLSALMTLGHANVSIALIVTEFPRHQIYWPYLPAKWFFADLVTRAPLATCARVNRIFGRQRVEGVEIAHLDSGQTESVACDTVVFTGDWIPEHELARFGGLALDPATCGPQADASFRTSARGVFAAGNLLRGAETADTSALEGRHAARQIHEFLRRDAWPERRLPIRVEAPLAWAFPNAVSAPGDRPLFGDITFRVQEFCRNTRVQVCQGDKVLRVQTFRRLAPNDSLRLAADWISQVDPDGDDLRLAVAR